MCECKEGYAGNGYSCEMKPAAFDIDEMPYYLQLKHGDRLDYGWRIREVTESARAHTYYSSKQRYRNRVHFGG